MKRPTETRKPTEICHENVARNPKIGGAGLEIIEIRGLKDFAQSLKKRRTEGRSG